MNMRSHDLFIAILPSPAVMIFIEALDIQFDRYQSHGCWAWILHWKRGICHETVSGIHVFITL
jgi:hypothetical protein